MLHWAIVVLLLFSLFYDKSAANESGNTACGDWIGFKDEKCFKILDDTTRTFEEAARNCSQLADEGILPVINSQEEQDFLSNYLFKVQRKVDNFWIGASYGNNSSFQWMDSTEMIYSNWDSRGPRGKKNYCVQIQADESFIGKWIGDPCKRKNLVVCQRVQSWSMARLQKKLLDTRKALRHSLDGANRKIEENKQNIFPIGFIYAQLPKSSSPVEIWPRMSWTDVSATYAGVFFRVNGGNAAAFGQIQDDNSPRLENVYNGNRHNLKYGDGFVPQNSDMSIPKSGWSRGIYTGTYGSDKDYFLHFKHSTGEVRPRNMAIRIWKRTA